VLFPVGRYRRENNSGAATTRNACVHCTTVELEKNSLLAEYCTNDSSVFAEQNQQQWPHPIIVRHNHVGGVSVELFSTIVASVPKQKHICCSLIILTNEAHTRVAPFLTHYDVAARVETNERQMTRRGGPPRSRAWEWILPKDDLTPAILPHYPNELYLVLLLARNDDNNANHP
jgi:hypothetical protein